MSEQEKIKLSHEILSKLEEATKQQISDMIAKGKSSIEIRKELKPLFNKAMKKMPKGVDIKAIQKGFEYSTKLWITHYLDKYFKNKRKAVALAKRILRGPNGEKIKAEVFQNGTKYFIRAKNISDETLNQIFEKYGQLEEANKVRGFIGGPAYKKQITNRIENLSKSSLAIPPESKIKHYTSAFAKAERDIRHDVQMEMVEEAIKSGNDLFWISSHADCSKRCEHWQRKLVSMSLLPINSKMETGKKVGHYTVYSFKGITEQKDQYGYTNNVIVGFNCRHKLIPYTEGDHPPANYSAETVKTERSVSARQRQMEKTIRQLKLQYKLTKDVDVVKAKEIRKKWLKMRKHYVDYSLSHNATYYPWRLN